MPCAENTGKSKNRLKMKKKISMTCKKATLTNVNMDCFSLVKGQ